jgi:hypothetical protein
MSNTKKVRVVIEGYVPDDLPITDNPLLLSWPEISSGTGTNFQTVVAVGTTTVSVEEIEPAFEEGDVVVAEDNQVYQRTYLFKHKAWFAFGSDEVIEDYEPVRPLKLIHKKAR